MKKIIFLISLCALLFAAVLQAQPTRESVFYMNSGATKSDTVYMSSYKFAAVVFSDSLDGTKLTIWTSSHKDSTFRKVQYDGSYLEISFIDNVQMGLPPAQINQLGKYIYFEATIAQTKKRWFKLIEAINF